MRQYRRILINFGNSIIHSRLLGATATSIELAAWLATKSGALEIWTPDFQQLTQAEREERLYPLWGRKMGPDDRPGRRTAEAYTANWIVAVTIPTCKAAW